MRWESKNLGELCTKITDGVHHKPNYTDSGIPFLSVKNLTSGFIDFSNTKFISEEQHKTLIKRCNPELEDILYTKVGTTGVAKIVDTSKEFSLFVSVALLKPKHEVILNKYLEYFLNSQIGRKQAKTRTRGMANKNLVIRDIKKIIVIFPESLEEQKRIVEILDKVFEGIDRAEANTKKNLANARELFESYLNKYFSLQHQNWRNAKLNNITSKIGSGATPKGGKNSYKSEGISLIRSLNVYDRHFKKQNLAFIDENQAAKLSNVILEKGDVLLNITGASIARCCVVPNEYLPARVNQHVSIIRPNKLEIFPVFLNYLITSKAYKDQLLSTGENAGSTRQALTKTQIQNFTIQYPTLKEQEKIVRKLNCLEEKSKKLEKIYQRKLEALAELKQSILQKAFTGEFTT